ncbi:(2Fe-2S)-binding protein [Haloechinothrix halophila]|uniref:(2Fe-2S)-binding protein n=1 Tax=Haloechinothrix halophila TaxID=1069073 RepID=UPI00041670FC|nr:(2Fe-2S)-binding protein [Haloechinothrix halophila]
MAVRRSAFTAPLTACPPGHSLLDSIARVNGKQDLMALRFGAPPAAELTGEVRGWHFCEDLLTESDVFDRWHDEQRAWLRAEYDEAPDRTAAGSIKSWYLQVPATLGALLFHYERRVPSLRPADLLLHIPGDGKPKPGGVALLSEEFACLPDDPAADAPEATVIESENALAALLRARYTAHASRFVAAYRPPVRFGKHALWGAATDAIDVALWKAGKQGGDEGAGIADAALVLPDRIEPFTSASTLHTTLNDGRPCWTRRKESCCFHYLLDNGKGACETCPRRSPPLTQRQH